MVAWLEDVERQDFGTDAGPFLGGPAKGVLHTTETAGFPGYNSGAFAPHLTVMPDPATKTLNVRQHVRLDRAAMALRNLTGGVETNRDGAIQVELVGTCDPHNRTPDRTYWPEAPTWALDGLRDLMRRLERACGIRPVAASPFVPYPKSFGNVGGQRMSLSQWDAFSGWCGHQHVPENDHGDPGELLITRLLPAEPVASLPVVKPLPPRPTGRTAPRYPLPRGHVFGPKTGPTWMHSGYYGSYDRNALRTWQAQMRSRGWAIAVDGLYGPQTGKVARKFQTTHDLDPDGLIGPRTWAAAWVLP